MAGMADDRDEEDAGGRCSLTLEEEEARKDGSSIHLKVRCKDSTYRVINLSKIEKNNPSANRHDLMSNKKLSKVATDMEK